MGLESRKKSGKLFDGSKLNVPGQGIYNVFRTSGTTFTKMYKENIGKPLSQLTTTTTQPTTTTTTINPLSKQFEDLQYFEFMDNISYEFEG